MKRKAPSLRAAMTNGRKLAANALKFRDAQRSTRVRALRMAAASRAVRPVVGPPARILRALGSAASTGVLLAEGDSWFDYPLHDVLRMLEDEWGYDVESVAHMGDRVEDMAYNGGQFEEFARRLEKLLRAGRVPNAILLSGGGNDIAGAEFALLLNHVESSLPPINQSIVAGVIDERLRDAYATMIAGLTAIATRYLSRPIPIVVHGYDYPIPDGRGFLGGFWLLPGPWLQPGFRQKGFTDVAKNSGYMKTLIDRFNVMLASVCSAPGFGHVHYLDLRGTLGASPYKTYWANELHPSGKGFRMVTARFVELIRRL